MCGITGIVDQSGKVSSEALSAASRVIALLLLLFLLVHAAKVSAQQKLDVERVKKVRFADEFPGADIGAKINAAIANCPAGRAPGVGCTVMISTGTYSYSTTIRINRCDIYLQGAGFMATTLNFTGAGNGLEAASAPNAPQCFNRNGVILEGFALLSSSEAGESAIQLGNAGGAANYAQIRDVWISVNASSSWQNGIKFVSSQNVVVDGGTTVFANTGNGIKNLITLDGDSRGDTFVGVSLTGKANGGTVNGVQTTGNGAEFFWYGGVAQGGFTGSVFSCVNCTGGLFGAHLELTSGNGDGVVYDNSHFGFTVVGSTIAMSGSGQAVRVGPTGPAWDFSLHGGSYGPITVGPKAHNTQLFPSQVSKAIVNQGVNTTIGQYRIVGNPNPQPYLFQSTIYSGLGAAPDGSVIYCSDCTIANVCAASGSGALAKRIGGKWVCN